MSSHQASPLPSEDNPKRHNLEHALVRTDECSTESPKPTLSSIVSAIQLPIAKIDRRPSLQPGNFVSTYFFELRNDCVRKSCSEENAGKPPVLDWNAEVHKSIDRLCDLGIHAALLGIW